MAKTTGKSMTERAYSLLREEILGNRLKSNAKINIAGTVARTGLSLASVREALWRLHSDGLVSAETNKGFRVAAITVEELQDLTRTRVMIESLCLENAIRNGGLDWESGIVSATFELSRTPLADPRNPERGNPQWASVHGRYHAALVAGCDSPWLLRLRETLLVQAERYRPATLPLTRENRDLAAEHKALAEATLARDVARATAAMADHLTRTLRLLIEADLGTTDRGPPGVTGLPEPPHPPSN